MSSLFVFDIKAPQAYGKLGGLFIGTTIQLEFILCKMK